MSLLTPKNALASLLILSGLLFITACSTPTGNVDEGKRWYTMHSCSGCHGEKGNDGKSPDITGLNMSYRSFVSRLRNAEGVTMPEFPESEISKQDAADLLAYINTL